MAYDDTSALEKMIDPAITLQPSAPTPTLAVIVDVLQKIIDDLPSP